MKKIIIIGFPHCGTTVLRSIIGNCKNVYATPNKIEERSVTKGMAKTGERLGKEFYVIKWLAPLNLEKEFLDYYKIIMIRNPYYVFSSIRKRFEKTHGKKKSLPGGHDLPHYVKHISIWNETKTKEIPKLYHLRYEDMFVNNYKKLKEIFKDIGLKYTSDTFDTTSFYSSSHPSIKLEHIKKQPEGPHIREYKSWQLNQPFRNMNKPEKLKYLGDFYKKRLDESKVIKRLGYKCG